MDLLVTALDLFFAALDPVLRALLVVLWQYLAWLSSFGAALGSLIQGVVFVMLISAVALALAGVILLGFLLSLSRRKQS